MTAVAKREEISRPRVQPERASPRSGNHFLSAS